MPEGPILGRSGIYSIPFFGVCTPLLLVVRGTWVVYTWVLGSGPSMEPMARSVSGAVKGFQGPRVKLQGLQKTPKSWSHLHRSRCRCRYTVDYQKFEYGPGTIYAGCPSLGFGIGGLSYSKFLAPTRNRSFQNLRALCV